MSHLPKIEYSRRGFTLAELMISATIIGVLGSVAIPSLTRYINDSKSTEGVQMLGGIRRDQSGLFQIWGRYSDRFETARSDTPVISFRMFSTRFNAIVGDLSSVTSPDVTPSSVLSGPEKVAFSQLNGAKISSDPFINSMSNGHFGISGTGKNFAAGVFGNLDADDNISVFIATKSIPLLVACDDVSNQDLRDGVIDTTSDGDLGEVKNALPSCDGATPVVAAADGADAAP